MPAPGTHAITLTVDDALCRRCRRCLANDVCRGSAFRVLDRDDSPFVDMSRCWGCLKCLPACPFGAVIRRGDPPPAGP